MKLITVSILLGLDIKISSCGSTSKNADKDRERDKKGYSVPKLDTLKVFLENSGASSMVVIVEGEVVFDWGDTSEKDMIHSMRKPLIHSLIGIAIQQQKIDTSMTMNSLGIEDICPKLSELESCAHVADLQKSKSGVYHLSSAITNNIKNTWRKLFL
jgi:hypothetical protein